MNRGKDVAGKLIRSRGEGKQRQRRGIKGRREGGERREEAERDETDIDSQSCQLVKRQLFQVGLDAQNA